MGRQAYLTRLALWAFSSTFHYFKRSYKHSPSLRTANRILSAYHRSKGNGAFGPPMLDEDGDFILGLNSHRHDNLDHYFQQFNQRGRPENKKKEADDQRLCRAMNEVTEIVGAVTRARDTSHDLNPQAKVGQQDEVETTKSIKSENDEGRLLLPYDYFLKSVCLWWLWSFQRRFQTFSSYSSLPIWEAMRSELHILGPRTFLSAGIIPFMISRSLTVCRQYLLPDSAEGLPALMGHDGDSGKGKKYLHNAVKTGVVVSNVLLFFGSFTFQAFSVLKSLHLVTDGASLSWSSLLPFTSNSPIDGSQLFQIIKSPSINLTGEIFLSPMFNVLLSSWLYDYLSMEIERVVFRVVQKVIIRPCNPDLLSINALKGDGSMDHSKLKLLGLDAEDMTPRSVWQVLNAELEGLAKALKNWFLLPFLWREEPSKRTVAEYGEELILRSVQLQRMAITEMRKSGIELSEGRLLQLLCYNIRIAFQERGLSDAFGNIELDEWIIDPKTVQESTSSPDPSDFFERLQEIGFGSHRDGSDDERADIDNSDMPALVDFPQTLDTEAVATALGTLPTAAEPTAHISTDVPASTDVDAETIDFRAALEMVADPNGSSGIPSPLDSDFERRRRRLVRAPTLSENIYQQTGATTTRISSITSLAYKPSAFFSARDLSEPQHRVSMLSTYPADALARYTGAFITRIILLPLESFYLRSLVFSFLAYPATRVGATTAVLGIGGDVRGVWDWFGGPSGGYMGRARYAGVMLLIMGMQVVVNAAVWEVVSRRAMEIGRKYWRGGVQD